MNADEILEIAQKISRNSGMSLEAAVDGLRAATALGTLAEERARANRAEEILEKVREWHDHTGYFPAKDSLSIILDAAAESDDAFTLRNADVEVWTESE